MSFIEYWKPSTGNPRLSSSTAAHSALLLDFAVLAYFATFFERIPWQAIEGLPLTRAREWRETTVEHRLGNFHVSPYAPSINLDQKANMNFSYFYCPLSMFMNEFLTLHPISPFIGTGESGKSTVAYA